MPTIFTTTIRNRSALEAAIKRECKALDGIPESLFTSRELASDEQAVVVIASSRDRLTDVVKQLAGKQP